MGYMHISNLYKNKDVLLFKQCYAMEKCHGTSASIGYKTEEDNLHFFNGGANRDEFLNIFNQEYLLEKFRTNAQEHPNVKRVTIYGEAYGGKMQGMKTTYGPKLKFIAFEVKIDDWWMTVEKAHKFVESFGLDFVPYKVINTTEEEINAEMMADSEIAIRNGMGTGKMREGIVLRPLVELIHPNGGRIISKHKRPEFAEREHTPKIMDPEELKILTEAKEIAEEWVTGMRLQHVLDKFPEPKMEDANKIIKAMIEDVEREAEGEILSNKQVRKEIGKRAIQLFKNLLKEGTFNS